jgi:hypothetical protein
MTRSHVVQKRDRLEKELSMPLPSGAPRPLPIDTASDVPTATGREISPGCQVLPDHYNFLDYVGLARWESYWYQLTETLVFRPESCLLVGLGDSTVSTVLDRSCPGTVVTLDIDPRLGPSVTATISDLPFRSDSLEHLPFHLFERCLDEIARVSRKGFVISLPRHTNATSFRVGPTKRGTLTKTIALPLRRPLGPHLEHQWEDDTTTHPHRKIVELIATRGTIENEFRVPGNPYHQFWRVALPPLR